MLVYIAELQHSNQTTRPGNYVPLAAGYLGAYLKKYCVNTEVKIFRDPNKLLDAVHNFPPDLIGFSVRMWAEKLALFCARTIKAQHPKIVTVAGGPNIYDIDSEIFSFLKSHPFFDVCVPNEGEVALQRLVEHIQENGNLKPDQLIDGCAVLNSDGSLLRGKYIAPDLTQVPSPYLDGILDSFLDVGCDVLMETARGCPYRCTFCTSGTAVLNKIRPFPFEQIKAEFKYICEHAKTRHMFLADRNFGILGKRDQEVAQLIHDSYSNGGFPRAFCSYRYKKLTEYVRNIAVMFKNSDELTISFQTLNPDVIKEIKRYNIDFENLEIDLEWASKHNIPVGTEMIFGFPGETTISFIDGIEKLMHAGLSTIMVYNLKILTGSDLSTKKSLGKYQLKTMFRRLGRNYGVYKGEPIIESEEIVVGTNTFDFKDFLKIRVYCFFLDFAFTLGYLSEFVRFLNSLGFQGEKLVCFLSEEVSSYGDNLSTLLDEYSIMAKEELFETHETFLAQMGPVLKKQNDLPENRVNWIFAGKIIFNEQLWGELLDMIRLFVRTQKPSKPIEQMVDEYLNNILSKRVITFRANEPESVEVLTRINLAKGLLEDKDSVYVLRLPEDAANYIKETTLSFPLDEAAVQDIFTTVPSFSLMRHLERKLC